jgi:fatty acid kinase fatty acid binding subunit
MKVGIVSDSTGYLPEDLVPDELRIVPVSIVIDGRAYDEGVELSIREVADALRRKASVTTSRPAPARFTAVFEELARAGVDEIVSIHVSREMSGTLDSAETAARRAPVRVHVVDSRTVGNALGFAARAACEAARAGTPGSEVASLAYRRAADSRTWLVVDSLDQLRRGGRIGAAQALVGSALSVKPLLQLRDGMVAPLEKLRTTGRAVARMAEIGSQYAGGRVCDVIVQHCDAGGRADELGAMLTTALPESEVRVVEVGAALSAHVGLGAVSLVVCPR